MCDALHYLLDNIFIRFGSKLYRQIVGYPMGTNCAPPIADLFLFCYERDFMLSLSENNQTDIIKAFNSTSIYLDDLLNSSIGFLSLNGGCTGSSKSTLVKLPHCWDHMSWLIYQYI